MAYDPTNGETPLANLPQYGGSGGDQTSAEYYAAKDFAEQFGRNPTRSELNMLSSAYVDPSGRVANTAQGKAAIAQYFQTLSNTPDQINKRNQDKYLKEAPQHFDAVSQQIQNALGRTASQEELTHFGSLLASGAMDAYGLQQFLQQQPEYQTKQNEQFQSGLSGKLAGYDKQYFQEQILPALQESYAKQGRSFDSTGFQAQATNSAQQQNTGRQQFLANLSAQQYGGVQDRAYQDYANAVANQQNLANSGIQAQYQGTENFQNRINQITDYNTQAQAYNQYLSRYGKRGNGIMGGLQGAIGGATMGSKFGPWGALAGGLAGGGIGYAGSQGGGY